MDKSFVIDMEEGATGGVSEEEMKLINVFRSLGLEPKIQSPEDVAKIAKLFGGVKDESENEGKTEIQDSKRSKHHYPKFSIFYGEENKGEVCWDTFRYEVMAALHDKVFDEEQILFGIRRSLKGSASDKLRRLGPDVTVRLVIEKLDSAYGTVESKESIMRRFYTCEQKANETVEKFASRLEELFDKAVELNSLRRSDTGLLKQVLHAGLKKELKHMSIYQLDKISNYDEFKKELRRIEADLKPTSEETKPCKPVVQTDKKEDSEVLDLLKQLNERIDKLEKGQQNIQYDIPNRVDRGRGRGRGEGRGRGYSGPHRPLGSTTFMPTCFVCNEKGHTQFDCPTILAQMSCTNCKQKGHIKKNCPN